MLRLTELGREHVLHALTRVARTERVDERGSEQLRVADRGEADEHRAVAKLRAELLCGGEPEPRLSRAARSGECHETHVIPPQERTHRGDFQAATHERRRRRRQA